MSARDAILQNFWLKLFSLVLATMIWFAIYGAQNNLRSGQTALSAVTRKLDAVPITVMQSAADFRAFRVEPSHIAVTVRGPIAEVQALTARQLEVFINLTDAHDSAGQNKKILVHAPAGIAVVQVSHIEARITPANND
jgi:YbbR domain-containing protein